jgi:Ras-related protein Rab-1A
MNIQYTFKIIIVGDSYTGKTTIFKKFYDEKDEKNKISHRPTIGVDFKTKELKIQEKNIKLHLWDTAGQERFRSIISSFYRGNDCVIFCYDITDTKSFDNIIQWLCECEKFNSNTKIVKILIGNKIDDVYNRKVSYEEGLKIANENNMEFFEVQ